MWGLIKRRVHIGETQKTKKKGEDAPLLVAVDEPRRDSTDVRTGAKKQEDNEQERLEIEKRRLRICGGGVSVRA